MSYSDIPAELRALNQWILWKYETIGDKITKVPYQINGAKADVSDHNTWNTFDNCRIINGYSGIGLVFSCNDDYSGIDLDYSNNPTIILQHLEIFKAFDSYSEISPSGKGLHIIVKGTVPSGRRKDKVEVYSSNRYFTMTGNVYPSNSVKPIAERQTLLTQLWKQMGPAQLAVPTQITGDANEKKSDAEIIEQAKNAVNGEKFCTLLLGKWNAAYPSQSEADYAFIDIIAFYTKNRVQIQRIFRNSKLGARPKAKRNDYVNGMIDKSFDQTLPVIDFSGFKEALERKLENEENTRTYNSGSIQEIHSRNSNIRDGQGIVGNSNIQIPPGLIGQIARFIYAAAPRPVPEVALAAAIGLMAGICGRAYNVSGTGLNQYVLLLAPTGTGKEAMNSGIDRLMAEVQKSVVAANEFIGPSEIASGQALVRYINEHSKCFVSIFDEFGHRLEVMSSDKANSAEKMFKRMLLQLFSTSGRSQMFKPSVFADKDKNTKITACPSFSLLGYSAPEKFYATLNEDMIADGLLPRFTLIEYSGLRPENNEGHEFIRPSKELINQVADLCAYCLKMMHGLQQQWIDIQFTPEALIIAKDFDKFADKQINSATKELVRQLWNRAHLKALKLAGLIAIGCDYLVPTISVDHINYAIELVNRDIKSLSAKFEKGETGKYNEQGQSNNIIKVVFPHVKDWSYAMKYGTLKRLHDAGIIPYSYISKRLMDTAAFRNDPKGATFAIKRAIQNLLDSGKFRELSKEQLKQFNTTQRCFVISDTSIFDEIVS